ncbi:unnamed protein product [Pylaiella littoralis]
MEDAISFGLLRSAVEMGEAVTEAGAISAVAAFFRQSMDACAWAEEETTPPFSTKTSAPDSNVPFATAHGNEGGDGAASALPVASFPRGGRRAGPAAASQQFELVVSRGPGPDFSEHETRVASQAAVLLHQALARIRDRAAFSEARTALEDSLQGMEEASEGVAVLVKERERRAQHGAQQMSDVEEKHARAMSAAGERLNAARREAAQLRRQAVETGRSMAVIAAAANRVCRTVSSAVAVTAGRRGNDLAERGFVLPDDDEETSEVIAAVERAARNALRCSFARVVRRSSDEEAGAETSGRAAEAKGEKGRAVRHMPSSLSERQRAEAGPIRTATSGRCADGHKEEGKEANPATMQSSRSDDDETGAVEKLHVPIPCYGGSLVESLVLTIHGVSNDPPQLSEETNRTAASALAAFLGTALLALREKNRIVGLGRQVEADHQARAERQQAAAASTAAAEAEAHERGERAVAGMRTLVAAAQASQAKAAASASATRRAERHIDALRHLLSGLGDAANDHASVAGVVDRLASAVVPGCLGAVLLTPRRHKGPLVSFSPDPRSWVAATATPVSKTRHEVTYAERDRRGRRRVPKGFDRQWTGKVEEAAAEAAATGKTVCVTNNNNAAFPRGSGGDGGGSSSGGRVVVCFSPTVAVLPAAEFENIVGSDAAGGGSCNTPCLIAWMLFLRDAGDGMGDDAVGDKDCSESQWASVSLLTEPSIAADADVESASRPPPPPPPTLPLPPRVSTSMQAVVHAVGLALAAIATAAAAATHIHQQRPERSNAGGKRLIMSSLRGDDRRGRKPHRDKEEMKRLRDGTAALTDRVQMLEERAAGLRASEARSAAALARLQLTALERDRLVRRLEENAEEGGGNAASVVAGTARREAMQRGQERGGHPQPLAARSIDIRAATPQSSLSSRRWKEGGGGLTGALPPYSWELPTTVSANAQSCGLTGRRQRYGGAGVGIPRLATDDQNWFSDRNDIAGVKEREMRDGKAGGEAKTARPSTAFERSAVSVSPLLPPPLADASSAALQHMASIHARLSDSLKRSFLSATTTAARV